MNIPIERLGCSDYKSKQHKMGTEDRIQEMYDLESVFKKLIEDSTKININSIGFGGSSIPGTPIRFTARFPEHNKDLKNTPYFLEGKKKLLHFTSLEVFFSIINEGAIRLYNLHNSNDPTEYEYASECLKPIYQLQHGREVYDPFISQVKQNSFILSTTDISELDNLFFWKEYARDGKGIAIELEIINNPEDWRLFYFSKVQYGELDKIEELAKNWHSHQLENPLHNYQIELNQLLSLYKNPSWVKEKEIRIYTQIPQAEHTLWDKHIFKDFREGKAEKNISYFKLPLCDKHDQFLDPEVKNNYFPKIRISNIYFGPDFPLNGKELLDLSNEIKFYAAKKNNIWLKNIPFNRTILKE